MSLKVKALSPHILKRNSPEKWYEKHPKLWDLKYKFDDKLAAGHRFFFGKYNIVKIDAWKRNNYHEVEEVMFHASFQILVNYVEREVAHMFLMDSTPKPKVPDPAAGLQYLDWEIELGEDSPGQSDAAKEVKELYLWYISRGTYGPGWDNDSPVSFDEFVGQDLTEEQDALWKEWADRQIANDEKRDEKDDEMLIRLIKIRRSMWT